VGGLRQGGGREIRGPFDPRRCRVLGGAKPHDWRGFGKHRAREHVAKCIEHRAWERKNRDRGERHEQESPGPDQDAGPGGGGGGV
jgi:hypothetical protein